MKVLSPLTGSAGLDVSSANVDTINLGSSGSENSDANVDNLTVWANADFKNNITLGSSAADTVILNSPIYGSGTLRIASIDASGSSDIAIKLGTKISESNISNSMTLAQFKTGLGTVNEINRLDVYLDKNYNGTGIRFYNSSQVLGASIGYTVTYGVGMSLTNGSVGVSSTDAPYLTNVNLGYISVGTPVGGLPAGEGSLRAVTYTNKPFEVFRGPFAPNNSINSSSISMRVGFAATDAQITGAAKVITFATNITGGAAGVVDKGYISITGSNSNSILTLAATSGTLVLKSDTASGSSDIGVKVGTTVADGTVNSSTKLVSVRTGIGDTETEKLYINKAGDIWNASSKFIGNWNGTGYLGVDNGATRLVFNLNQFLLNNDGISINDGVSYRFRVDTQGNAQATSYSSWPSYSVPTGYVNIPLKLYSVLGTGSTEVVVKAGSSLIDSSVDLNAKIFSVRTGLTGSEAEYFYVSKNFVSASKYVGDGSLLTGITASATQDLRKLLYYINNGPADTYSQAYLEITPSGSLFPTSSIWYTDSTKTAKIYEEYYERYSGSATLVQPNPIQYKLYQADGVNVLITATDTITYAGPTILSISRSIT